MDIVSFISGIALGGVILYLYLNPNIIEFIFWEQASWNDLVAWIQSAPWKPWLEASYWKYKLAKLDFSMVKYYVDRLPKFIARSVVALFCIFFLWTTFVHPFLERMRWTGSGRRLNQPPKHQTDHQVQRAIATSQASSASIQPVCTDHNETQQPAEEIKDQVVTEQPPDHIEEKPETSQQASSQPVIKKQSENDKYIERHKKTMPNITNSILALRDDGRRLGDGSEEGNIVHINAPPVNTDPVPAAVQSAEHEQSAAMAKKKKENQDYIERHLQTMPNITSGIMALRTDGRKLGGADTLAPPIASSSAAPHVSSAAESSSHAPSTQNATKKQQQQRHDEAPTEFGLSARGRIIRQENEKRDKELRERMEKQREKHQRELEQQQEQAILALQRLRDAKEHAQRLEADIKNLSAEWHQHETELRELKRQRRVVQSQLDLMVASGKVESSQTMSLQAELASIDDQISRVNEEMNELDKAVQAKQDQLPDVSPPL